MADLQAFLVIIYLTWATVSVSVTTPELSTTTDDTVNIPCLFGESTVHNIYWYYNNGTRRHKILFLARGGITLGAEYENRASLQDDNSTLILTNITVADEGTYSCDVDRQGQTAKTHINTKLNVFSLRTDTLPVITPCTGADESSSCSIQANQSFTLTCTLPNVYPVEDTELIWYRNGKHFSSTHDVTPNDDGTTDISRQIQVSETRNFTCNATYFSANGRENTAVSVEALIIPPADVTDTPGKEMTTGVIAGTTIAIGIGVTLAIIILIIYCLKKRGRCASKKDKNKRKGTELDPVENSISLLSSTETQGESVNRNRAKGIANTDTLLDNTLSQLAEALAVGKNLLTLGLNLGFRQTKMEMYLGISKNDDSFKGTTDMLFDWKAKTPIEEQIPDLVKALIASDLVSFAEEFFREEAAKQRPKVTPSTSYSNVAGASSLD